MEKKICLGENEFHQTEITKIPTTILTAILTTIITDKTTNIPTINIKSTDFNN